MSLNRSITSVATACVAAALTLTACGSSGGGSSVSQSQIEAKLKKDSDVTKVLSALPASEASKKDAIYTCMAKALKKDADGGDLDDYVHGNKSLDNVSGKDSSSEDQAKTDVTNCLKTVLGVS